MNRSVIGSCLRIGSGNLPTEGQISWCYLSQSQNNCRAYLVLMALPFFFLIDKRARAHYGACLHYVMYWCLLDADYSCFEWLIFLLYALLRVPDRSCQHSDSLHQTKTSAAQWHPLHSICMYHCAIAAIAATKIWLKIRRNNSLIIKHAK